MTNLPKVSVIIPTFNGRESLKRAVLSVLNQDLRDVEVVVVDDNPEDSKPDFSELLLFNSRVRVVRNTGRHGPSQSRNFGVSRAYGEVVTFLDDDDCYMPGRLTSLVNFFEVSGDKYSFISSGRFSEVGDFSRVEWIPGQKFGVITLGDLLHGNTIDIGVLMKKRFFEELGGFDESLSSLEDWDFFLRALKVKDGFKIHRFDYAVNRSEGRHRVSQREASGYAEIARKYTEEFGEKWAIIPKVMGVSIADRLSCSKAIFYSYRASSFVPAKLYLSSHFPRLIRILKRVFFMSGSRD